MSRGLREDRDCLPHQPLLPRVLGQEAVPATSHRHDNTCTPVQTSVRRATSRAGDCSAAALSMPSNWRRGRELE